MHTRTRQIATLTIAAGLTVALLGPSIAQAQTAPAASTAEIAEISVEHTPCFGTCPVYKITLRRDGTATFVGSRFVDKIGTYTGNVYQFDHLARAVDQHGFGAMKPRYTSLSTDLAHVITTVVRGGKRQTVDNYGSTGPQALWEIETLIDGDIAQTQWKKVGNDVLYPPTRRF